MNQLPLPADLRDELDRVDAIVRERLAARAAVRQVAASHTASDDARARAALALLAARIGPRPDDEAARHAAATVTLIYAAARVHDDLINAAERRRGLAENEPWQGDVSLMVGDYLFALAASEMARAPDARVIAYVSQAVMAISEGQLAPVLALAPLHDAVEQYLYRIGSETAALFKAACKAGMVCGGGTQAQIDALGEFGQALGMAFQITDDLRDFGTSAQNGTAPGTSLRAGIITLPLIYAADAEPRAAWAGILDLAAPSDEQVGQAIAAVRRSGADLRARADAQRYTQQALVALDAFDDSAAKRALRDMALALLSNG